MYWGYSIFGTSCYLILHLLLPILKHLNERYSYGIEQRLGKYNAVAIDGTKKTIWIHASSIGEVKVGVILIKELTSGFPGIQFVLTCTTAQGQKLAGKLVSEDTICLMAPIDVWVAVRKAIRFIDPDIYICIETELWPVMLKQVKATAKVLLLNGRISERSYRRYQYIRSFLSVPLQSFSQIAAISESDAKRFISLGALAENVQVCGNIKSSFVEPASRQGYQFYAELLQINDEKVFLCGSTHANEEKQLMQVYNALSFDKPFLLILAPRHIERIPEVSSLFKNNALSFDYFSSLQKGEERTSNVVLVDTMGDLTELYVAGDYNFCGGSLVEKGGHNIMEPIQAGKPVFYGPYVNDFSEIAERLETAECSFRVQNSEELLTLIKKFEDCPEEYQNTCRKIDMFCSRQNTAVEKQVALVENILEH